MQSIIRYAGLSLFALAAACSDNTPAISNDQAATSSVNETQANDAAQDWTRVIEATAEGGFRMGNPDAKIKIVEFGSFTCPHCADFHEQGLPALKEKYISTGNVSYEFRSFILNQIDVPVTLLAYCVPASAFFAAQDGIFATQENWIGNFQNAQAEINKLQNAPQQEQLAGIIKATKLDGFFKMRGLPAAKQEQCLADNAMIDKISSIRADAVTAYKLTGTPSFLINGTLQDNVFDWNSLKPKLDAALN